MSEGGKESLGIGQSPEIHECPQKKGSREETESEDTRAGGWDAAMGSGNPGLSKAFKEKVQKEVRGGHLTKRRVGKVLEGQRCNCATQPSKFWVKRWVVVQEEE